jgi:glycosyltransferase involved in cell wall biosynthesis
MSKRNPTGPLQIAQRLVPWGPKPRKFKIAGNYARDNQNWLEAAAGYRAYLELVPGDGPLWVQYGHALKESGAYLDAELAYKRAVEINPADTDALLHLGHLLKRQGNQQGSAEVFLNLLARAPSAEAVRELQQSGHGHQALTAFGGRPVDVAVGGIFLELSDLFQYLGHHVTVTGITRVTLSLINYILEDMPPAETARYYFVHQYGDGEGLLLIPREKIRRMVKSAMYGSPNLIAMQALIHDMRSTSSVFRLKDGDTYLIVGAFWEFVSNPSWINGMRQRGVRVGAYIYDLIPISHAQYCMQELTDAFSLAFADTARLLDFALTISAFVAEEVKEYLDQFGIKPFPITPVPLAHALRFEGPSKGMIHHSLTESSKRQYFAGIPFVLCVCTIEARKNHEYLFSIWQRMIDAGIDVPDLVFVGRPGWRVESLMDRIKNSDYLNGRLHILFGLSDDELSDLYERCLFTAFPSFVEGWGLPVGESLSHGKICVASSTSSIPEVGGDHVLYCDPFNINDGYATISRLLADKEYFERLQSNLRTTFTARTWNDVGRDFFNAVSQFLADLDGSATPREMFAPHLVRGRLIETTKLMRLASQGSTYALNPERLIFASGWRHVEGAGTWMLDADALLAVRTDCTANAEVSVLLHLGASPWVGSQHVLEISTDPLHGEKTSYRRPLKTNADFWVTFKGRVDGAGTLRIRFDVSGAVQTPGSETPVSVRLLSVGYAPTDDSEAQIGLLERALLG